MKSAHRHQLETNALAQRLDVAIERFRPYAPTVIGIAAAAVIVILIWSWVSSTSAARRGEAWNAYHQALGSRPPDLNELHQFAQEYPGTPMQQLADITWADGQVFEASQKYFENRETANRALEQATGAYQSILRTTDDPRLINRAHLGLGRVYEMRNELEKAREEYLKVGGGYEDFAKQQAERLAKPETKEAYDWLAKAEARRTQPPAGPGTPGQRPEFSPGDLSLPDAQGTGASGETGATPAPTASFDEILEGLQLGEPSPEAGSDASDPGLGTPITTEDVPPEETPSDATNAAPPAEPQATPPASDAEAEAPASDAEPAPPATEEKPAE